MHKREAFIENIVNIWLVFQISLFSFVFSQCDEKNASISTESLFKVSHWPLIG